MGCGRSKRSSVSSPTGIIREEIVIETLLGDQETLTFDLEKPLSALYAATRDLFKGRYPAFRLFCEGRELGSLPANTITNRRRLTLVPWPNP